VERGRKIWQPYPAGSAGCGAEHVSLWNAVCEFKSVTHGPHHIVPTYIRKLKNTKSETARRSKKIAPENGASQALATGLESAANAVKKIGALPVVLRSIGDLKPHPLHADIYGAFQGEEDALMESVKADGILTPLLITAAGIVISGAERLRVAQALGRPDVPVRILDGASKLDIEQLVIASNVSRDKTNEQRIREYQAYKRIEQEKAKPRKGKRTDLVENLTPGQGGKSRDIAAAQVGWSGGTAEKGMKVVNAIEKGVETENMQDVEEVRTILNDQSVDAAYKKAQDLGWIEGAKTTGKTRGTTPAKLVQESLSKAKTAAGRLAEIVNSDQAAQFTPAQNHELREALLPVLKWVDGFEPSELKEAA